MLKLIKASQQSLKIQIGLLDMRSFFSEAKTMKTFPLPSKVHSGEKSIARNLWWKGPGWKTLLVLSVMPDLTKAKIPGPKIEAKMKTHWIFYSVKSGSADETVEVFSPEALTSKISWYDWKDCCQVSTKLKNRSRILVNFPI